MPANTTDRVRQLHDRLTAEVDAFVTSEEWTRFLSVAARFHNYSTGTGRYSNCPNAAERIDAFTGIDSAERAVPA